MEDTFENNSFKTVEELNSKLEQFKKVNNKSNFILRLYSYLGILVFIVGTLLFVISFYRFKLTENQTLLLLFSGVGIIVSLLSSFLRHYMSDKQKQLQEELIQANQYSDFILNWTTLEKTINRLVDTSKGINNKLAISNNLDTLYREGKISNKDYSTIEKALSIRNKLVHAPNSHSTDDLNRINEQIQLLSEKLTSDL